MAVIPFAFSAHHFISSVGADAGFAALIGLAILVLLFFAQARETASLRQRAAESDEQLRQLSAYVERLSRPGAVSPRAAAPAPAPEAARTVAPKRVAAQPRIAAARAGAGAPVASAPATGVAAAAPAKGLIPAAPAGVGAPALSAATRLIPTPEPDAVAVGSAAPGARAGAGAGAAAGSGAAGAASAGAAVLDPPGPSTAAGGANGSAPPRVPANAGATRAPAVAGGGRGANSAGQAAPRVAIRRDDTGAATRPPGPPPRRAAAQGTGGSRLNRGVIAAATVLVVAIIVAVLLVVTNSGGGGSASSSSSVASQSTQAPSSTGQHRAAVAPIVPSTVTVAVLNGTSTTNLAHDVMAKLVGARYKQGQIATASNQTLTATIVGYLPGFKRDALAVAKSLKLEPASVQAVNASNRAVACSGQTQCAANVVVTVGSDLASDAT